MIRKKDLGALDFIARGAVGSVYRLPNLAVAGHPPLAYKEVDGAALAPQDRRQALDSMAAAVAFRAALGPADQADLDEYTTWPIDLVEENGTPCGLVMPLIPPGFFIRTNPSTGTPKDLVFDLSWLCAKESQAKAEGIDRSGIRDPLVRIALLAQLVYAVGRLHRHGAVYGDLSLKNAALAVGPPRVKLLDCDATAALSDLTRKQMHSPFFAPPEIKNGAQKLQDTRTDVYKLGLCIIRGLQQGPGVSQSTNPAGLNGTLDAHAVSVVARAVGADRDARPTARELFDCLERNVLARAVPPQLLVVRLSRTALPRGQDVEVVWEATGGTDVRLTGPNGLDIAMPDPGTVPASRTITPPASGEVFVEVSNKHGSVRALAGEITLYELPAFRADLTGLPRPLVPTVPAVAVPPVMHALPPVPVASLTEQIPRVELPQLTPVAEVLSAMRSVPAPLNGLAEVASAVDTVTRAMRRVTVPAPPHPDLGAAATRTVNDIHGVFDEAGRRLRDRMARDVDAALRKGARRT